MSHDFRIKRSISTLCNLGGAMCVLKSTGTQQTVSKVNNTQLTGTTSVSACHEKMQFYKCDRKRKKKADHSCCQVRRFSIPQNSSHTLCDVRGKSDSRLSLFQLVSWCSDNDSSLHSLKLLNGILLSFCGKYWYQLYCAKNLWLAAWLRMRNTVSSHSGDTLPLFVGSLNPRWPILTYCTFK